LAEGAGIESLNERSLTEEIGNLMLAIQARSFNNYFYLQSNNTNHPARFIPNSVTGILFENKVDHASKLSPLSPPYPTHKY
jgi:endo-1,3(4)-beta-glucanase